jgi:putative ABC transport system substrate-binding protein
MRVICLTAEDTARALNLKLQVLKVASPKDFAPAFDSMRKSRVEAAVQLPSAFLYAHRARLVELAVKHKLPMINSQSEHVVEAGGLMSYAPNFQDMFRRSATYVDKILKGSKPAELPVQQPTKFELVINLKTAKQIGVAIPQSLLYGADKVIK